MNFRNLTQFDLERSAVEAVWFYVVYAVLGFLITVGIGLVILPYLDLDAMRSDALSVKLGRSIAIILSSGLTLLIVLARNFHTKIVYLALILVSAVLGAWGGLFLGLIIPALLTTRGLVSLKREENEEDTGIMGGLFGEGGARIEEARKEPEEDTPKRKEEEKPTIAVAREEAKVARVVEETRTPESSPQKPEKAEQKASETRSMPKNAIVSERTESRSAAQSETTSESKTAPRRDVTPEPIKYTSTPKGETTADTELKSKGDTSLPTATVVQPPMIQPESDTSSKTKDRDT